MKKILIMAIALMSLTSIAQHKDKTKRADYTPEQMATLQTKRMTLALDLSAAQQNQVQAIELKQATSRKAKMQERKTNRDAADAKKPTADEMHAMRIANLDQQIAHKAEMKKILSAEQYEQWNKMNHKKGKREKASKGKNNHKKSSKENKNSKKD